MRANALLVRYQYGWWEVGNVGASPYRTEALLGLGAVTTSSELVRIAQYQLALFASPRTAIAGDTRPVDSSDTPYLAFVVGDTVEVPDIDGSASHERVIAMNVAEDDYGNATYAPEFKDVILSDRERWQQNLDKLANGSMSGNSGVAQPVSTVTRIPSPAAPEEGGT